jgi:hypothetical protein
MTTVDIGLVALTLAILAFVFGRFATARVIALIVGIVLVATAGGGHLFSWATSVTSWLNGFVGTATTWAVGVAFPGLLAIVLAFIVAHDLHPKTGTASRRTFFAAGLLAVMIAAASTNVSFLNGLGPQIQHGVQNTQNGLGG